MSATLKGLLQPAIQGALTSFGTEIYAGPPNSTAAQAQFADVLATAIAGAVYTYLQTNVQYIAPAIPAGPLPVIPTP